MLARLGDFDEFRFTGIAKYYMRDLKGKYLEISHNSSFMAQVPLRGI
jgi:hypothetical protein